jgi:hypothetical protein
MKRALLFCLVPCALCVIAIAAGTTPATKPASKPDPRIQYGVISENNIFLKERRRRDSGEYRPPTSRVYVPPVPEKSFVLTGIVLEDEWRAYIEENAQRSRFHRVGVGDQIGRGHVAAIEIDAIAYEYGGKVTWIPIGKDLTGDVPPNTAASYIASAGTGSTTAPATTGPTTGPAVAGSDTVAPAPLPLDPNNPNLSFEERMKLRRIMEQQKK